MPTVSKVLPAARSELPRTPDALLDRLGGLADAPARRALLSRVPHLHDAALVHRLADESMRSIRVDLARAERFAYAARWVAGRVDDACARARSRRTMGHVLSLRGRYHAALVQYRGALALLRSGREDEERAITLTGALQTLIYLGQYERAHDWAREARGILSARGDTLRLARLDTNVGNVLFRQDLFQEALDHYHRALAALRETGDAQDVGVVLRNIVVCWISLGDVPAALAAHREAQAWCAAHGLRLLAAEIDYNIAYLHYQRGRYAEAIALYEATRNNCRQVGDPYHEALCDLDQSEMYLELNLDAESGDLAARAYRVFRGLRMPYEMGKALVNMGASAARGGEPGRALVLFEKARRVFRTEGNPHWLTITDVYRSLVLREQGLPRAARRLCRSALEHFERHGPPVRAALCELLLARLDLDTDRSADAWALAESAITRAERAQASALEAHGYLLLGEIHDRRGDAEAAYAAFRQAHAGLETLRSRIGGDQLKIAFLKDKLVVFENLVSLALQREPPILRARVAFRYIEQAKSRSLADQMAGSLPPRAGGEDGAAIGRLHELRTGLAMWYRRLDAQESESSARGRARAAAIRQRAREWETRFACAQATLEHADAEFRVLGDGAALPLATIQSAIPSDTALVEYYEARGTIVGCVLTRDRLEIVPLAPAAHVGRQLRLLQFQLSKFGLGAEYLTTFAPALLASTTRHLAELHDALIAPLSPRLHARHLVVVPHRALHYLPFHALFDGDRFLVDRVSVSYAPSATVYYLCRTRVPAPACRSLVLGVPDPRAPHILDEVQAVSAALPEPAVYLGAEATDQRLRDEGPACRYIHIATHGLFRQGNPMLSAVRLGNGELSLLDLYRLRLSADLVTLSGCGTGLSAVVGGDELIGLVRGLMYAGARSMLATLWDVNDRSTACFMRSFYTHLQADADKGRAMAAATRDLKARYPHPYFWAPFVLIGDPGAYPYVSGSTSAGTGTGIRSRERGCEEVTPQ